MSIGKRINHSKNNSICRSKTPKSCTHIQFLPQIRKTAKIRKPSNPRFCPFLNTEPDSKVQKIFKLRARRMGSTAEATMTGRHFLTHKEVESYLAPVKPMEETSFHLCWMMEQLIHFKDKEELNQKSRPPDGHKDQ